MTLAQQIRDWLAAQDAPRTCAEIGAGIGMPHGKDNLRVHYAIGQMFRTGQLAREGIARGYRYSVARELKRAMGLTREEAKARKRARDRERYAAEVGMTHAEFTAWQAARKAQRAAELAAQKAATQQARDARQAEARQRYEASRRQRMAATLEAKRVQQIEGQRRTLLAVIERASVPAPVVVPAQTVEEFLAQGGQVQRLGIGEVSKPVLRFQYAVAA
jgi:hypothetical protein